MKFKKILREPLLYLLPLLAALYLIIIPAKIEISDVKLTEDYKTKSIKLPYSEGAKSGMFSISFNISIKNKNTAKFNIIPDNCLQKILINGETFPLDGIQGLCDWAKGAYFDFSKYVADGHNHFEFHIMNDGGPRSLRIEAPYNGLKQLSFLHYVFALLLLFSVALILRKFKFKLAAILIISLGIGVRLIIYTYTGPMQNSYDVEGHLNYIQIISEEKRIPKVDECWSCYHPPLYYTAFAVVKNIADRYDPSFTNRISQQGNLLLSFASIALGVALIISLFGNRWVAYLAALVAVLWPGFVWAAPRIGNDALFYFGALFCMLFAQRYWYLHRKLDILLATIGASIALAAKSTGLVILGVWVMVYILGTIRHLRTGSLRILFASAFIIILFMGFSNYRMVANIFEGKGTSLVGNINVLNNNMRVNNTMGNYLYFDLQDYIMEPYASTWIDKGGRQYFWNFSLKTSLFGEFRLWDAPVGRIFATTLSILALLIFMLALWGIIHARFKDLPPLLFIVFLFTALIYLRISYPYSCSNDFRYIFPALFPIVYFAVHGTQILENSRLRLGAYFSMASFLIASFLFIVLRGFSV